MCSDTHTPVRALALLAALSLLLPVACGCSMQRKLSRMRRAALTATLSLPPQVAASPFAIDTASPAGDTLVVKNAEGKDIFIMRAVRDEATGEMIAEDVLRAAVVSATFRNVAERDGNVVVDFKISVPSEMTDEAWQMRLRPTLLLPDERIPLDEVIVTGKSFREGQLRGYRQYERFLGSIVPDADRFVRQGQVALFEARYGRLDGTPTHDRIRDHYTDKRRLRRNEWRKANRKRMFDRYVKTPFREEGLRIDTLFNGDSGLFTYRYVQPVTYRPGLRKIHVVVSGEICEGERKIYDIPQGDSLTFYVSTLGSLVDGRDRFLTRIVSRRVAAEFSCHVDFPGGSSNLVRELGNNGAELDSLHRAIEKFLSEGAYAVDSVVTVASASPEGSFRLNERLSQKRGECVNAHLRSFFPKEAGAPVFISRSCAENWALLRQLVERDTLLSARDKRLFAKRMNITPEDRREEAMRRDPYYPYLRTALYPQLRTVVFDLHLHRRGMVQDTLVTTVIDTAYMAGVQALRDGAYQRAAEVLGRYRDYNAALALCSLGKNHSARQILEELQPTPSVEYMLAIIHARLGHERTAIQHYVLSCEMNPAFLHRGNLDPEIATLRQKYHLNPTQ